MTEMPITSGDNSRNLIQAEGGTLETVKGIHIVRLKGSDYEMGRQHGLLAAEVCGDIVPEYFDSFLKTLVAHAVPVLAGPAAAIFKSLFYYLNRKRIGRQLPDHTRGMCDAQGMDARHYAKMLLVPDILHYLIGRAMPMYVSSMACSGFMARDKATAGGRLLVGRNFDFYGKGVWNTNSALIIFEPKGKQKYCWMGSLGLPASGQAMNESGLIVSLHTHFTRDVRMRGMPLYSLFVNILESCTCLEEAVRLIKAQPRICGLSMFIVDTRARDAAVVGFSAGNQEVLRPENDVLIRTNHYLTPEMKAAEVMPLQFKLNTEGRYNRIRQLITEKYGHLTPDDIPAVLADRIDPRENRKCLGGNIVCATNNAYSAVFSPEDDALWVARGPFPVCAAETFTGFRTSALFDGDRNRYAIEDLKGGADYTPDEYAALMLYEDAWEAHFDNLRDDKAIFSLRRAMELAPHEPIIPKMAGFLLLRGGKFAQALPFFEKNAAFAGHGDLMRAEALIWLGRCLDLTGRRKDALAAYEKCVNVRARPISGAARRHLDRPYRPRELSKINPEFIVGSVFAKY